MSTNANTIEMFRIIRKSGIEKATDSKKLFSNIIHIRDNLINVFDGNICCIQYFDKNKDTYLIFLCAIVYGKDNQLHVIDDTMCLSTYRRLKEYPKNLEEFKLKHGICKENSKNKIKRYLEFIYNFFKTHFIHYITPLTIYLK